MKCFNVLSCHESFLAVNDKKEFIHTKDSSNVEKIIAVTTSNSDYALLITLNKVDIKWLEKGWSHNGLLVRLKKISNNQGITIFNPVTKTFLTPIKSFDALGYGKYNFNVVVPKGYEFFSLVEVMEEIPNDFFDTLEWFVENISHKQITAYSIILLLKDMLLTFEQKRVLLSNLLAMISKVELTRLVEEFKKNSIYFKELQTIYSTDIWLNDAIPNLLIWLKAENKESSQLADVLMDEKSFSLKNKQTIPEGLDFLAKAGNKFHSYSPGQLINSYFRKSVVASKRVCVIVTVRNEGIYLLEWVAYYRALGFDGIYIYSNDNSDGSDELLSALAEEGLITWINNVVSPKANAQGKAYSHALSILPEILDYEWTLTIDLDEFIWFNKDIFDTFFDFLDWHEQKNTEAIAFNWVYIGSGQEAYWKNKPITRRLKNQIGKVNRHIKTMVRTNLVLSSQPHFPRTDEKSSLAFYNSNGNPHTFCNSSLSDHIKMALSDNPDDNYACLYHYFFRSAEEFLWKWSRNREDYPRSEGDIFIALNDKFLKYFLDNYNDVSHDSSERVKRCLPELEKHIENYLNIPKIKNAQDIVLKSFKIRSQKVLEAYKNILEEKYGLNGIKMLNILNAESHVKRDV